MKLKVIETGWGCIVPVSHRLNENGYFRRRIPADTAKREMFHRTVFRDYHGLETIPPGFEIDHMCGTRACFNVNHLRMISVAQLFWRWTECSSSDLSAQFGLAPATAASWIGEWRAKRSQAQ